MKMATEKNGNFELVSITEVGRRGAYTATEPHAVLLGRICCPSTCVIQRKTSSHINSQKYNTSRNRWRREIHTTNCSSVIFQHKLTTDKKKKKIFFLFSRERTFVPSRRSLTLYQRLQSENQLIYWSIFHNFRLVFRAVVLLLPHCQS